MMGMATSGASSVEPKDQVYRSEMEKAYDKGFAEIEFRALRAMHMNYEESTYFDELSRRAEWVSYAMGVGIFAVGVQMMHKQINRAVYLAISALPATGVVQYAAVGQIKKLPSFNLRAQNHVDAGARWMKLHRLAAMYRQELSNLPLGSINLDEHRTRYMQLLDLYQEASECTVIREKAYTKFKRFPLIEEKYLERLVNRLKYDTLKEEYRDVSTNDIKDIEGRLEEL